jgi:hypothetical protein
VVREAIRTKAIHGNSRVVDDKVNAISVRLLQVVCERFDAAAARDIKQVEFNLR